MKLFSYVCILTLLLVVSRCSGHIGGGPLSVQDVSPQIYCGRILALTLARVCYREGSQDKRSDPGTMYGAILAPYYRDQEAMSYGWPWISAHKARSLESGARGKRLVVNECCDKPCSIDELISYC